MKFSFGAVLLILISCLFIITLFGFIYKDQKDNINYISCDIHNEAFLEKTGNVAQCYNFETDSINHRYIESYPTWYDYFGYSVIGFMFIILLIWFINSNREVK